MTIRVGSSASGRGASASSRRCHEIKRCREVSEDTVQELRNGLVQLRQYGDSLASRKQIVEVSSEIEFNEHWRFVALKIAAFFRLCIVFFTQNNN